MSKDSVKKGLLIVGSGPSGVGKGTVHSRILAESPNVTYSISVTSRKPRIGERDGVDYFFRSAEQVKEMIANDEFLEYADVFGNYYGTPRDYVLQKLNEGKDVLLEIDVQGALQVKKRMPEALLIFLAPPNQQELERRLRNRCTDDEDVILRRLHDAEWELSHKDQYDYVIVNDTVDDTVKKYLSILQKEKEKRK
ncbi:MAG: guanylate kinase [Acidaminococcaceae bacterium]|nr:guanylate kinase [Acidaminococcaceae bacterium]